MELVDAIRKRGIPGDIIVLSAHVLPEIREAYERLNVQAIFPKPFDLEELRSAVDHLAPPDSIGSLQFKAGLSKQESRKNGCLIARFDPHQIG